MSPAEHRSGRRPSWIELDLGALSENVGEMRAELGGTALMVVVKANAYGHGALPVARAALGAGASWLATATVEEGLELRAGGVTAPVLALGYTPPDEVEAAVAGDLAVTVFDADVLAALEAAGAGRGRRARGHLKVDSGMSRLGLEPERVGEFLGRARGLAHVELEGCYTHFRMGEDAAATGAQLERFRRALDAAEAVGHHFRVRHAANSAAWRVVPESRLDLVRSGIEPLGLSTPDGRRRRPVLSLRATVAQVRDVAAGEWVGYGEGFRADSALRLAVITLGYGDGFRRSPRNWGGVLVRGRELPLVGSVCMDMAMVDVSSEPEVLPGQVVTAIGRDGGAELSAETVAERLGTVNYEVTTALAARLPRDVVRPPQRCDDHPARAPGE